MNADGHIRIKTKIDNSNLSPGMDEATQKIEKKIRNLQRKADKQKVKIGVEEANIKSSNAELERTQTELKGVKNELDDIAEDAERLALLRSKLESNEELTPDEAIDFGALNMAKVGETESELLSKMFELESQQEKIKAKIKEQNGNLQEQKQIYAEIVQEIETQQKKIEQIKYNNIKDAFKSAGNSLKSGLKTLLKWGLAVLSIRSAMAIISRAASTLSQYNDELRTKIEGIRLALASALEPVIVKIVDFVIELLRYVNAISVSLFGWDLFKNAKNMKSMSKSAKEIKNSLAGFDEMNVLADSSSSGSGASGKGIDLSPKDLDTSVFYNWIDKVSEIILKGFDRIRENIKKVLQDLGVPKVFIDVWEIAFKTIESVIVGVFTTIKGAFELLVGLLTGDTEKVKEGFTTMLKGIAIAIISLVEGAKTMVLTVAKDIWEGIKKVFSKVGEFFTGIWNTIKSKFTKIGTSIGEAVSNAFKTVINSVITFAQNTINKFIKAINKAISAINVIPGVNIKKLTEINIPKLATGGVVNRPTYAQIGEAGREAVLPLDRNTEWMNELAKKINSNGGVVNVYLDGRLIQRQYNQRQEEFNFATNGGN